MNKPVAWLINGKLFEEYFRTSELDNIIPLYTHPVKELTDEEIIDTFVKETGFLFNDNPADGMDLMGFAKAILRKAQEK